MSMSHKICIDVTFDREIRFNERSSVCSVRIYNKCWRDRWRL